MEPMARGDDAVAPRTSYRSKRALASARALGRRHVSKLCYVLALLGVPAAVIIWSGGFDTIGFWIITLVWVAAVVYGTALVLFTVFMILSPIVLMVERMASDRVNDALTLLARVSMSTVAAVAFVEYAQLGDTTGIHLPTPWPNLGALLVISSAVATAYGLLAVAGKHRPPKRTPGYLRPHSVPEPDEEYWSDQLAVGWRAWNWDGSSLRGVYARWPTELFVATCSICDIVPFWDHVCGVYAVKSPGDVHVFHTGSPIIGRVEMWGDVIEHELGYRASHARITHLWVSDPLRAKRIGSTYPSVNVYVGETHVSRQVA